MRCLLDSDLPHSVARDICDETGLVLTCYLIACQEVNRGIVIQYEENTKDTFLGMEGFGI